MKRTLFKPKMSEPCLCGSGKKYRDCCWGHLPGYTGSNAFDEALSDENYGKAIMLTRAEVTQYTIWHKTNTVPVLSGPTPFNQLLRIDVNAMAELTDRLLWLYYKTGRSDESQTLLDRLDCNIQHKWWHRKIVYFKSFRFLMSGDLESARVTLNQLGPIPTDDEDIELLQLHIDINGDTISFSEKLSYIDQILELARSEGDKLQYRGSKAIQYFLVGDNAKAESELDSAIVLGRQWQTNAKLIAPERLTLARLMNLLGSLRQQQPLIEEANEIFSALLRLDHWTEEGRIAIQMEIADGYRYSDKFDTATEIYRSILAAHGDKQLARIHLAQTLYFMKEPQEALTEIRKVAVKYLGKEEFEDFAYDFGMIALVIGTGDLLQEARGHLSRSNPRGPYLRERQMALVLCLSDKQTTPAATEEVRKPDMLDRLAELSNIFELKPNFFGIGLNLNAMIEQANKNRKKE